MINTGHNEKYLTSVTAKNSNDLSAQTSEKFNIESYLPSSIVSAV